MFSNMDDHQSEQSRGMDAHQPTLEHIMKIKFTVKPTKKQLPVIINMIEGMMLTYMDDPEFVSMLAIQREKAVRLLTANSG